MEEQYLFENAIGSFVFDKKMKFVGKEAKGKDLKTPNLKEKKEILVHFKKKEYYADFRKVNIEITKQAIYDSFSRDALIIQGILSLDELARSFNTLSKRLSDWYNIFFPELSERIKDHEVFAELVSTKRKDELMREFNIKTSMGGDPEKADWKMVKEFAVSILKIAEFKKEKEAYLEKLMQEICPNILEITGITIGARLISHAGSMKRLMGLPSSTVQLLGAEKALFRHIKNKKNLPPKYGLIHEHPLIAKVKKDTRGKAARILADKISIAARVDYFKGDFVGDKLKKEIETKLDQEW